MIAADQAWTELAPRVALTISLAGWTGVAAPFAREAGRVPARAIDEIEAALAAVEQANDLPAGAAFAELAAHALSLITNNAPATIERNRT
jgi:hypothetical protein